MNRRGLMGVLAALALAAFTSVPALAGDSKARAEAGCACCGAACVCPACSCDASKAGTSCDCCGGATCCSAKGERALAPAVVR